MVILCHAGLYHKKCHLFDSVKIQATQIEGGQNRLSFGLGMDSKSELCPNPMCRQWRKTSLERLAHTSEFFATSNWRLVSAKKRGIMGNFSSGLVV